MVTFAGRSMHAGLETKQRILEAELLQIDRQIRQEEEALARIEERIQMLQHGRRQAA